jgi:ankyrin repeat domain-containing protein 13
LLIKRNRSGIWGWRTDKNDTINGYDCRVYTANNLQLVTKTRVEHLNSERAKEFLREQEENDLQNQMKQSNSNLPGFLGNLFQGSVQNVKVIYLYLFFNLESLRFFF